MNTDIMFSSKSDEWETPQTFFENINKEFNFNLDPCATKDNHKCEEYYTYEENGLTKNWGGKRVFCNPPYSKISEVDMGYKFDRFDFMVSGFPFCILPSVKVIVNDMILCQKNISVVSEWLCFHFRWRWLKEELIVR